MNTGYLAGYGCPKCGNRDELIISVTVTAAITDRGVRKYVDEPEWDEDSDTACGRCGFLGTLRDFHTIH